MDTISDSLQSGWDVPWAVYAAVALAFIFMLSAIFAYAKDEERPRFTLKQLMIIIFLIALVGHFVFQIYHTPNFPGGLLE